MEGVLGNVLEQVPIEGVSGKGNDLSLGVVGMYTKNWYRAWRLVQKWGVAMEVSCKRSSKGEATVQLKKKKKNISVLKNIIHIYNIGLKIRLFIFLIF